MYCPECGSPAIYEAPECDGCGEVFRPQDLVNGFCEDCRKEYGE
jgi:predicted amidophosphoribosyltransferase